MICLDTNAVIALLNASEPVRAQLAAAVRRREVVAIFVVVLYELCFGAAKSASRKFDSRPSQNSCRILNRSSTSRQTIWKKQATSVQRSTAPGLLSDRMTS